MLERPCVAAAAGRAGGSRAAARRSRRAPWAVAAPAPAGRGRVARSIICAAASSTLPSRSWISAVVRDALSARRSSFVSMVAEPPVDARVELAEAAVQRLDQRLQAAVDLGVPLAELRAAVVREAASSSVAQHARDPGASAGERRRGRDGDEEQPDHGPTNGREAVGRHSRAGRSGRRPLVPFGPLWRRRRVLRRRRAACRRPRGGRRSARRPSGARSSSSTACSALGFIGLAAAIALFTAGGGGRSRLGRRPQFARPAARSSRSRTRRPGDHVVITPQALRVQHLAADERPAQRAVRRRTTSTPTRRAVRLVHNLEHGAIVIQHGKDVPPAEVDEIVEWYRDGSERASWLRPCRRSAGRSTLTAWTTPDDGGRGTGSPRALRTLRASARSTPSGRRTPSAARSASRPSCSRRAASYS